MSRDGLYTASVTALDVGPPADHQFRFALHASSHGRELWSDVNPYMALIHNVAFRDINGDGTLEIAYSTGGGGTGWTLAKITILSISKDGQAEPLEVRLPIDESTLQAAGDLDGDGDLEWTAIDASWEVAAGFCHACSPAAWFVLDWDDAEQAYLDASPRFAAYLLRHVMDPMPPSPGASCEQHDAFLSGAVGVALIYGNVAYVDDEERVIKTIEAFEIHPALREKRDAIARSLRTDPHDPTFPERASLDCPPE